MPASLLGFFLRAGYGRAMETSWRRARIDLDYRGAWGLVGKAKHMPRSLQGSPAWLTLVGKDGADCFPSAVPFLLPSPSKRWMSYLPYRWGPGSFW